MPPVPLPQRWLAEVDCAAGRQIAVADPKPLHLPPVESWRCKRRGRNLTSPAFSPFRMRSAAAAASLLPALYRMHGPADDCLAKKVSSRREKMGHWRRRRACSGPHCPRGQHPPHQCSSGARRWRCEAEGWPRPSECFRMTVSLYHLSSTRPLSGASSRAYTPLPEHFIGRCPVYHGDHLCDRAKLAG